MAKVSSSNTTTLYSTTQTTPIVPGTPVSTGPVNNTNFTTLYSQTNGVPGGGASDDLLVKGNLRVLGTSDLEGQVTIGNSYSLPTSDGTPGQVMATDGNGHVSFVSNQGKTYDITASTTTGGANFNLNSDVPTTDTIKFAEGSGISVTATSANEITIASTSPGTTYDFNASSTTGGANLNLVGSDASTDTVKLTDGGHITATYTSATEITLGSDATSNNTASTIVARDSMNNFSAGSVTLAGDLAVNGGDITTTQTNASLFNTTATTISIGGAASTISIGASGSTTSVQNISANGYVKILGAAGYSQFSAPASGSNLSYILPGSAGAANTVLTNDGSGNLSWAAGGGGGGGGNVTIGVDTAQTISTTSGNLILQTAAGVNAGTITLTAGTDGAITLQPNGAGDVYLTSDVVIVGDSNVDATITTNGSGDLILNTNSGSSSGFIRIWEGNNQPIDITPAGTGNVRLVADTIQIGDSNVTATVTTIGTGDLVLNTNSGTNSGSITVNQGTNGNIEFTPNGTGRTRITNSTLLGGMIMNGSTSGTVSITPPAIAGTQAYTLPTATPAVNGYVLSSTTGGVMSWIAGATSTGNVTIGVDSAQTISTTSGNLILQTAAGVNAGTITLTAGTNGNITLTPNGTGDVILSTDRVQVGDATGTATIATLTGVGLTLSSGSGNNFISIAPSSNMILSTSGAADVEIRADTLIVGDTNATATVTTSGTGNLLLNTNDGTNSGSITIAQGAAGNITLTPDTTGRTSITNGTIANNLQFNGSTSGTVQFAAPSIAGTQAYTLPTATPAVSGYVLSSDTSGVMSWAANGGSGTFGNVTVGVDTVQTISTTSGNLILQTAAGVNSGQITLSAGTNGPIIIAPDGTGDVHLNTDSVRIGDNNATATIITRGTGDLVLTTHEGSAVEGTITLSNGANGNITLAPNGTGDVVLSADTVVVGDAAATATITSNGAGDLVLNTNSGTNSGSITLTQGTNGNITISPNGTGQVIIDGGYWPTTSTGVTVSSVLTNDGSGNLSWALPGGGGSTFGNVSIGVDTDQTISTTSGNLILQTAAGVSSGTITLASGANGNITVEPNGTGDVYLSADTVIVGDSNATATITSNGTGNLVLNTNNGTNSGSITIAQGTGGNITLTPDTTGDVILSADTVQVGDANATATVTTNGTGNLVLNTNNGTTSGSITIAQGTSGNITFTTPGAGVGGVVVDAVGGLKVNNGIILAGSSQGISLTTDAGLGIGLNIPTTGPLDTGATGITFTGGAATISTNISNGNITLQPNGTGDVILSADTVQVGDANATATVTTNGTGNLVLNTNNGTNAGSITLANGTNGNITLSPNGTGVTLTTGLMIGSLTNTAANSPITGRHSAVASNSVSNYSLTAQKFRSDILLAAMTDEPAVLSYQVRDSGANLRTFGRLIGRYQGTGTNPTLAFQYSVDNFTTTATAVTIGAGTGIWGATNSAYTHTTNGTGNLTLNTNSGTNSGAIVINQGANANITLTPNGTGQTKVTNLNYNEVVYTAGSTTGTITPDAANGTIQSITLTGSITFNAFSNPVSGQTITMVITQPAAGGPYTLTSTMKFAGGAKTLSTAANAIDILTVSYIGTTYYASLATGFA